jgi:voltage-gated potassium channel
MVSGGDGSELYRVTLPEQYLGMTVDDVSRALRADHRATLLAIKRGEQTFTNPPRDFVLQPEDDALVLAESLGALAPLTMHKRALAFVSEAEGEPEPASARETAGA